MEFIDAVDATVEMTVSKDEFGTIVGLYGGPENVSVGIYLSDDQVNALIEGIRNL